MSVGLLPFKADAPPRVELLQSERTTTPSANLAGLPDLSTLENRSHEPETQELIRQAILSKKVRVVPDLENPERIRLIPGRNAV